jgi:hypothetical protein
VPGNHAVLYALRKIFWVQPLLNGRRIPVAVFARVASRREPVEGFHFGVNSLVQNAQFALYRDFSDSFRHRGEERF